MEGLDALLTGLRLALTPTNLIYLLLGVTFGTLVGVLPGIGPAVGIVLLIPFTFELAPATALIMLSGVYYGAMYGGSTTSILLNVPGEAASVMTAVEGHPLARQGRAGAALGMSAISSFFAGTLAVVGLTLLAVPMAALALSFGPPEEVALILAAFTIIASLGGRSMLKGLAMGALGVLLATIGLEPMAASTRLHFGIPVLHQGVSFVAAAIGLFALPEVMSAIEKPGQFVYERTALKIRNLLPSGQDFKDSVSAFPLGASVGFVVGVLPGAGATIASFVSYAIQRRISRHPERFGKGSIEAVATVEGANNAASTGALLPMLTFGIPGSGTAAILLGAMLIHGLRPGPLLFQNNPEVVWGLVASMYLGNAMLLILNMPLIGIWITVMRLPIHIIMAAVLAISVAGVYAEENALDNVFVMFGFGVLGYLMKKLDLPAAPIILALVLTTMLEASFHRSMLLSSGDWSIFLTRPIALGLLILAVISIVVQLPAFSRLFGKTRELMHEEI